MRPLPEAYATMSETLQGQSKRVEAASSRVFQTQACRSVETCRLFEGNVGKPPKRRSQHLLSATRMFSSINRPQPTSDFIEPSMPDFIGPLDACSIVALDPPLRGQLNELLDACSELSSVAKVKQMSKSPDSNKLLSTIPLITSRPPTTCPANAPALAILGLTSIVLPVTRDSGPSIQTAWTVAPTVAPHGWGGIVKLDLRQSASMLEPSMLGILQVSDPNKHQEACSVGQTSSLAAGRGSLPSLHQRRRTTYDAWCYETGAWIRQKRGSLAKNERTRPPQRHTPWSPQSDADISTLSRLGLPNPVVTRPTAQHGNGSSVHQEVDNGDDKFECVPGVENDITNGGGNHEPHTGVADGTHKLRRLYSFRRRSTFREFAPWTIEGDGIIESETEDGYGISSWQLNELLAG